MTAIRLAPSDADTLRMVSRRSYIDIEIVSCPCGYQGTEPVCVDVLTGIGLWDCPQCNVEYETDASIAGSSPDPDDAYDRWRDMMIYS